MNRRSPNNKIGLCYGFLNFNHNSFKYLLIIRFSIIYKILTTYTLYILGN